MPHLRVSPMVVVCDGRVVSACLVSPEIVQKTIEGKKLWYLDPSTGTITASQYRLSEKGVIYHGDADISWYSAHVFLESDEDKEALSPRYQMHASTVTELSFLRELSEIITSRKKSGETVSYTAQLFREGDDRIRKKVGEEAMELILSRSKEEMTEEAADLLYHMMVFLTNNDLSLYDCVRVLFRRHCGRKTEGGCHE